MRACWSSVCGRGRMRGRGWWWRGRWGVLGGGVLALAAVASVLRVPGGERRERVHVAGVSAALLAHTLADFTAHPPPGGEGGWHVREEHAGAGAGNLARWSYRVTFTCGARCEGEARVYTHTAHTAPHTVHTTVTLCTTPPLLPSYLAYCDELEVESSVSPAPGESSVLEERSRARCCALRVLAGACSRLLDAHRTTRTHTLASIASIATP